MQVSISISPAFEDNGFRIYIKPVVSEMIGPYYQVSIGPQAYLSLTDAQCKELMDALGSRPHFPKSDAELDAEAEEKNGPDFEHQANSHVAEPFREILGEFLAVPRG